MGALRVVHVVHALVGALYTNHTHPLIRTTEKEKVRPKRGKVKQNKKQMESRPHPKPRLSRKKKKRKLARWLRGRTGIQNNLLGNIRHRLVNFGITDPQ